MIYNSRALSTAVLGRSRRFIHKNSNTATFKSFFRQYSPVTSCMSTSSLFPSSSSSSSTPATITTTTTTTSSSSTATTIAPFSPPATLKHHSTNSAIRRGADIPPIAVDSWVAICDGNAAGLGHPREYIQLKKLNFREPSSCKYCGLRYLRKGSSDFAHAHE